MGIDISGVDILGVNILGVDILGVDILGRTQSGGLLQGHIMLIAKEEVGINGYAYY